MKGPAPTQYATNRHLLLRLMNYKEIPNSKIPEPYGTYLPKKRCHHDLFSNETYIKVRGRWMSPYRVVDSKGMTIDFHFSKTRDNQAAKCLFKKALQSFHVSKPPVMTVDKNPAYSIATEELKKDKSIPDGMQLRQQEYLNNIVEQDHRFIEKRIRSMLGFKTFRTAKQILCGAEVMHLLKKAQL